MEHITVGTPCDDKALWTYSDVPKDKKGWTLSPENYRPIPFDICFLKVQGREKPINGWWDGLGWYGLRLKKSDKVINWKFNKEFT